MSAVAGSLVFGGRSFRYLERPAPGSLCGLIAGIWRSNVGDDDHRLRVVPDGCVELSVSAQGHTSVFGPATSWCELTLAAGDRFTGMRLAPGAARAVLGTDIGDLRNTRVDGSELGALRPLTGMSGDAWVRRMLDLADSGRHLHAADTVAVIGPQLLAARARGSISTVARTLGVSERQFRRRFGNAVGLSPASFRRIVRVQRAVAEVIGPTRQPLAQVAHGHGFADQAHFTREVVAVTGATPARLRVGGCRRQHSDERTRLLQQAHEEEQEGGTDERDHE